MRAETIATWTSGEPVSLASFWLLLMISDLLIVMGVVSFGFIFLTDLGEIPEDPPNGRYLRLERAFALRPA